MTKDEEKRNRIRDRMKLVSDKLKPFLPKDTGFLFYDKVMIKETEIEELFHALVEMKYDISIKKEKQVVQ